MPAQEYFLSELTNNSLFKRRENSPQTVIVFFEKISFKEDKEDTEPQNSITHLKLDTFSKLELY